MNTRQVDRTTVAVFLVVALVILGLVVYRFLRG